MNDALYTVYTGTVTLSEAFPVGFQFDFNSEMIGFVANPFMVSLIAFVIALAVSQGFVSVLKRSVR